MFFDIVFGVATLANMYSYPNLILGYRKRGDFHVITFWWFLSHFVNHVFDKNVGFFTYARNFLQGFDWFWLTGWHFLITMFAFETRYLVHLGTHILPYHLRIYWVHTIRRCPECATGAHFSLHGVLFFTRPFACLKLTHDLFSCFWISTNHIDMY